MAIDRETGYLRGEAGNLCNLGNAHYGLGNAVKAVELYEQALEVFRKIGDRRAEGTALGNLGTACAAVGNTRKAVDLYDRELVIARENVDRNAEAISLLNSAFLLHKMGQYGNAIERAEMASAIFEVIGSPRRENVLAVLASWRDNNERSGAN